MTVITSRQKGRQRERKGSRLPAEQKAQCRALSQDPETMSCAEGRDLTHWATQVPLPQFFKCPNHQVPLFLLCVYFHIYITTFIYIYMNVHAYKYMWMIHIYEYVFTLLLFCTHGSIFYTMFWNSQQSFHTSIVCAVCL